MLISLQRFGTCNTGISMGQLPSADPLFTDVYNRLSYRQYDSGPGQPLEATLSLPQGSLTGASVPRDNTPPQTRYHEKGNANQ